MFATSAAIPAKYIAAGSYDRNSGTLFIQGDKTYGVSPNIQVNLTGRDVV
jgi:hypothetical protein